MSPSSLRRSALRLRAVLPWAALLCALAGKAQALSFAVDTFEDYSVGSIAGNNGGTGWAGAWTGQSGQSIVDTTSNPLQYQVVGGDLVDGGSRALKITGNNDGMATRTFDTTYDGTIFTSFLMRVDSGTLGNNDFVSIWYSNIGPSGGPSMGLKANEGSGDGPLDFFARTRQINNDAAYSTEAVTGETYLLVGKLEKTGANGNIYDRYSLWVNPDAGASGTPDAVYNVPSLYSDVTNMGIRSVNLSDGVAVSIDGLRYAPTFEDAISSLSPTAIPFNVNPAYGILIVAAYYGVRLRRKARATAG